jgi:hypothetical protein
MIDPISILTAVQALSKVSVELANTLVSLQQKYRQCPRILSTLVNQCNVANHALIKTQTILESHPHTLASKFDDGTNLKSCFNSAVVAWGLTFSVLDSELSKYKKTNVMSRVRYWWNERTLNDLSDQLRSMISSMDFLLGSIQMQVQSSFIMLNDREQVMAIDTTLDAVRNELAGLRKYRQQAQSFRDSYENNKDNSLKGDHEGDLKSVLNLSIEEPSFEEVHNPLPRVPSRPPKPKHLRIPKDNYSPPTIVSSQASNFPKNYFVLSPEEMIVGGNGSMRFLHMRHELQLSFTHNVLQFADQC